MPISATQKLSHVKKQSPHTNNYGWHKLDVEDLQLIGGDPPPVEVEVEVEVRHNRHLQLAGGPFRSESYQNPCKSAETAGISTETVL